MKKLQEQILERAQPYQAPNQRTYSTLILEDRDSLAAAFHLPKKNLEIAALKAGVVPQRYLRNIGSLSISGQLKLLQARVLLMGTGGLGGTIGQLLARTGLGTLILADGDFFNESNLNRQAFSFEQNIGRRKVDAACSEILKINAAVEIETFSGFVGENDLPDLLRGVDAAVDALDNMTSRFLLEKACKDGKVPMVHGAVGGFFGQVMTIYPEDVGLRAFYGESAATPEKGIEVELGNLAGTVSAVASLQVLEVIKIITGMGRPLRDRLLFLDTLNGSTAIIPLATV